MRGRPKTTGKYETRKELEASVLEDYNDLYRNGNLSESQVGALNGVSGPVVSTIVKEFTSSGGRFEKNLPKHEVVVVGYTAKEVISGLEKALKEWQYKDSPCDTCRGNGHYNGDVGIDYPCQTC